MPSCSIRIHLGWLIGVGPVIEPYRTGTYQDGKGYTAWDLAVIVFAGLSVGR